MKKLSFEFGQFCKKNNLKVATAESCTAGLIGASIAMTPGSSAWLDRGFIVYTAEAKNEVLGVLRETIDEHDITSVNVAHEMALGALRESKANLSLAVTGLAGPGGGTEDIPVGTVCMAWAYKNPSGKKTVMLERRLFEGDRNEIREAVVAFMLTETIATFDRLSA